MSRKRTWIVLSVVALVGVMLVPIADGARKPKIKTKVTMNEFEPVTERAARRADVPVRFLGSVSSKKAKCKKRRTVNVFKTFNGETTKVGTGKTNRKGKFGIVVALEDHNFKGDYVAKAKKKRAKKFICKKGKSAVYSPWAPPRS